MEKSVSSENLQNLTRIKGVPCLNFHHLFLMWAETHLFAGQITVQHLSEMKKRKLKLLISKLNNYLYSIISFINSSLLCFLWCRFFFIRLPV